MSILGIILLLFFVGCGITGYKKGLVEEVIKLCGLVLGAIVLFVLIKGIGNFLKGSILQIAIAVLILSMLLTVDHVVKIILKSFRLVSKLPVIHWVNKLCGTIFGIAEGVVICWLLFIAFGYFHDPVIQPWIERQVQENMFVSVLYHNNYVIVALKYFYLQAL